MPDNQELHIGTVSKPRLSPETVYNVEYTQTLPTNQILIYSPYTISNYPGNFSQLLISVSGRTFGADKTLFYRTDVDILDVKLWTANDSTKVGAPREFRWVDMHSSDVYITMINLTDVFPSNYANWDFISEPTFGMTCYWRSYLIYDYVNIEAIPDEATRLSLTQDDIYWTDYTVGASLAWIYVVETNTLWVAVSDPLGPSTDPPGWRKHTEGIIIDFPQGINRKQQYIARCQAIPGALNTGNKAPISYRGMIQNPDDGTVMEISGTSIAYTAYNSPTGASPAFVSQFPDTFRTNGDVHGYVTMTETPQT